MVSACVPHESRATTTRVKIRVSRVALTIPSKNSHQSNPTTLPRRLPLLLHTSDQSFDLETPSLTHHLPSLFHIAHIHTSFIHSTSSFQSSCPSQRRRLKKGWRRRRGKKKQQQPSGKKRKKRKKKRREKLRRQRVL